MHVEWQQRWMFTFLESPIRKKKQGMQTFWVCGAPGFIQSVLFFTWCCYSFWWSESCISSQLNCHTFLLVFNLVVTWCMIVWWDICSSLVCFFVFLYSGWRVVVSAGVQWCFLLKENICKQSMLNVINKQIQPHLWNFVFAICLLIHNTFQGKSSPCKLYYSIFILRQMGPIGAKDEPLKKAADTICWRQSGCVSRLWIPPGTAQKWNFAN